ncbi:MAG: DNA topoisomerase (ATP-hydrolyzing) subunit A [Faecalibacterium prausnitzii]|nr:DNA topoisomerase (ATP-hydrolyzing) subunit A [Faecalibacterium prausnitzii]MDD7153093.1 DNA topoisomerase (ATP-hydrolyzing) subunit A [Faecalibacterium prausnitzii]MDY2681911.1 DNA topoisomerase (ATP-hydrolyzing) subunit A [Faecalibacterium prausnitzii]
MAKKSTKKTIKPVRPQLGDGVEILNAGSVLEDPITRTLEVNYMPYAMSVIVSRALPEIDGFKPAHRKLLYTMYEMGLLKGARTKSANIVGSTMHLNPHGDAAIYDTMVRMGRGNESLLMPFVDSKGNFGKAYSRDMSCAAARYTEAKLEPVCEELFRDIDRETVDFVPNYDGTTTEPTLLPVTFPTILANNTLGIAVGMACNICSFNLAELCATTVALMKDEHHDIASTMPAPDFVGGGQILYDEEQMRQIYENGRGSVKVRARYNFVPGENMIEITQIPPTTTVEAIMDRIAELVKTGKVKEISDMRDETDLNGLKLTLDLKRGVDAEKLMSKLFRTTPLEDSFSANFNILVSGQPRVMGVREILREWTAFRMECVRRRTYYDLHGKEKRLHLLQGLAAILLDIDKAIRIIRTTEEEEEVVPNLMIGFGIDEVQADYVAEIKLRHLNREYILKRTSEIQQLETDIADLQDILAKPARIRRIIMKELAEVSKKYAKPRRTEILYDLPEEDSGAEEQTVPDYPVTVFYTREGYLKKIPPQSLRTAGAHKLKEGDEIIQQVETRNDLEALFFTDKQQVYKVRLAELEDGKVAQMGIYVPGRLGMEEGENILSMVITRDYSGHMLFFFAGGKCARIPLASYATKQNRRKLLKAYSDKEPLAALLFLPEDTEIAIRTSAGRMLLVGAAQIAAKTTRDSQGVAVVTLKKNQTITSVVPADTLELADPHRYRVRTLPATGALIRAEDKGEQMSLL